MTSPTLQTRGTPGGKMLEDGYQTLLAIEDNLTLKIWEKDVGNGALEAGDPIELTNMHNVRHRTFAMQSLILHEPFTIRCSYDPAVETTMYTLIGQSKSMTLIVADGSTKTFFGSVKRFAPDDHSIGELPEADLEIVITNWDATADVEVGPEIVEVSGT